jgi:uncharacterized glyoxalase superfamily protein PhnB
MPMIAVNSVDATREFYIDQLHFSHQMAVVGQDGQLDFCTVFRDGARIMFTRSEDPVAPAPSMQLYLEVRGVQDYYERLKIQGIAVTPIKNMWWGDRVFIVTDPNGYKLWFYESVGTPEPPEGMKIV